MRTTHPPPDARSSVSSSAQSFITGIPSPSPPTSSRAPKPPPSSAMLSSIASSRTRAASRISTGRKPIRVLHHVGRRLRHRQAHVLEHALARTRRGRERGRAGAQLRHRLRRGRVRRVHTRGARPCAGLGGCLRPTAPDRGRCVYEHAALLPCRPAFPTVNLLPPSSRVCAMPHKHRGGGAARAAAARPRKLPGNARVSWHRGRVHRMFHIAKPSAASR